MTSDQKPQRARYMPHNETARYIVYAIKEQASRAKQYSQRFASMDEAASACITLREQGNEILGVRLPSGNYVMGSQIEWSIGLGVSCVKIALSR